MYILESLRSLKDSKGIFSAKKHVTENVLKYRFICKIKFVGFYKEGVLYSYVMKCKGWQILGTCNPGRQVASYINVSAYSSIQQIFECLLCLAVPLVGDGINVITVVMTSEVLSHVKK